jgi:flagellar basal body-associated protein FliL
MEHDNRHMSKKKIIIVIIIVIVVISIGVYTVLPLFTNTVVDEPLPTAAEMSLSAFYLTTFIPTIQLD